MGKFKIRKMCSSIVVMLIMCMTLLNGKSYATGNEIIERYVYDDTFPQEAFEYGTLYDDTTFEKINKNNMTDVYKKVLNDLKSQYSGKILENILVNQIQDIEQSYSIPNDQDELEKDWLDKKVEYAQNNMTIFEYADKNNKNDPSQTFNGFTTYNKNKWSNDFYVNWHLLCCNWGTNLEDGQIKFKQMDYEYASPSQAFILNCSGDGYGEIQKPIKNETLHYFLTEKNNGPSTVKLSDLGRKTGLTAEDNPTYLQYTEWHSEGGNVDGNSLPSYPYYMDDSAGEGTLSFGGNMYNDSKAEVEVKRIFENIPLSDILSNVFACVAVGSYDNDYEEGYKSITDITPTEWDEYGIRSVPTAALEIRKWEDGKDFSADPLDTVMILSGDFSKFEKEKSNTYGTTTILENDDGSKHVDGYLYVLNDDYTLFGMKGSEFSENDVVNILTKDLSYETESISTTGTKLDLVADAYEAFIKRIAKSKVNNLGVEEFDYEDVYHEVEEDGELKTKRFKFPKIDEDKIMGKVTNDEKIVNFNKETQQFVIGPMTIGGSDAKFRCTNSDGTVEEYEFAKIGKFEIQSNLGILQKDVDWHFLCNGQLEYDYPDSGEQFEVIIPYKEGLTEITSIDYEYKYLKAVANYYYFSDGETLTGPKAGQKAQEQRMLREAARWYESISESYYEPNLELVKKAVDENGNELSSTEVAEKLGGKKQYAYFKVNINYNGAKDANGNDIPDLDEIYEVEAGGEPIQVPVQKWDQEGTSSPHYTVKEVTSNGDDLNNDNDARWTLDKIENPYGDLTGKNTVRVVGTNKLKSHTGKLKINKKVQYENGQAVNVNEDTDFIFHLDILRKSDQKLVGSEDITLTVKKDESTAEATSKEYTWYGDEVLEYKLTETDSKGYISDGDKEGTLDNKIVEVTCENNIDKPTPVTLTLKKLIKDGVPPGEKFTFLVKTEGAIDNFGNTTEMEYVPIVLDAGQEATFKFTPESKTTPVKYWVYEYIPENSKTKPNEFKVSKDGETITDIIGDDIKEDVDNSGWYPIVEGEELTGGESVTVEATNEVTPTKAHLTLTKTFDETSTKHRVAIFKVTVEVQKDVKLENPTSPETVGETVIEKIRTGKDEGDENYKGESFIKDTVTSYTEPDEADATHYVTYVAGYIKAGEEEVTKWVSFADIANSIKSTTDPETWESITKSEFWDNLSDTNPTWDSGYFKWLGAYELKYHIEEDKVYEVDLDNAKINDVTNQYTSEISTPDGNTEGRGTLYEDEARNAIKAYNGDKIVTLTVGKQLDQDGAIDNDKEFSFDVKVKGVTKVLSNNGTLEEDGNFTDKPKISVNNGLVKYKFEYEGEEPPTFEVKEIDNEDLESIDVTSTEGKIEDITDVSGKVIGKKGSLQPGADVTFTATNKLPKQARLTVTKKLYSKGNQDKDKEFDIYVKISEGTITNTDLDNVQKNNLKNDGMRIGLRAGESKTFYVKYEGDTPPNYEVWETKNDNDYKIRTISTGDYSSQKIDDTNKIGVKGTLKEYIENEESTVVTVTAKNELPITKKIKVTKTINGGVADNNEEFTFDLLVIDANGNELIPVGKELEDMHQIGGEYAGRQAISVSVPVKMGSNTGSSVEFEYKYFESDGTPTYYIDNEEAFIKNEDGTKTKISGTYNPVALPKKGNLGSKDPVINVDVLNNKETTHEDNIKVVKEFTTNGKKQFDGKKTVYFNVGVKAEKPFMSYPEGFTDCGQSQDGYYWYRLEDQKITIEHENSVNAWTSGNFVWKDKNYDLQANTTIEETKVEDANGNDITAQYNGTVTTETKDGETYFKITNDHKEGKLTINKTFIDDEDANIDYDRVVTFNVNITVPDDVNVDSVVKPSEFKRRDDGKTYTRTVNMVIPHNQKSGSWTSGAFKWAGDKNLEYNISEGKVIRADTGAELNYAATISPEKGELSGNVNVDVTNTKTKTKEHTAKLKIKKEWYNLKETLNKSFDFEVSVVGVNKAPNENGTYNNGTFTETITIPVGSEVEYTFTYSGDTAPTYTVKELGEDNDESKLISMETSNGNVDGRQATGSLDENAEVTVTAKNTPGKYIKISKQIKGKASDRERFDFTLIMKQNDVEKETKTVSIFVEKGQETGESFVKKGQETGESDEYEPYFDDENGNWSYEIKDEKAYIVDANNKVIKNITDLYQPEGIPATGTIAENPEPEIEVKVLNNRIDNDTYKGIIPVTKIFKSPVTENKNVTFNVDVSTPEKFVTYPDDFDETGEEGNWHYISKNGVATINIAKNSTTGNWNSGEFEWKDSNYDLISNTKVTEVTVTGNTNTTYVSDTAIKKDDKGKVYFEVTNTEKKQDFVKITKTISGKADNDEIFVFELTSDGYGTQYGAVKVKAGEKSATYRMTLDNLDDIENNLLNGTWDNTSGTWQSAIYEWLETESAPVVEIKELSDYSYEIIDGNLHSIKDKYEPKIDKDKITLGENSSSAGIDVKVENNDKTKYAKIDIKKLVSGKVDENTEFKFNLNVYGIVGYRKENSDTYTSASEGYIQFKDIVIKPNEISDVYYFKYYGKTKPLFEVMETDTKGCALTSITGGSKIYLNGELKGVRGSLTGSEDENAVDNKVTVIATNNGGGDDNYKYAQLKIKKEVTGNTNKAKTFKFNVKVSGASKLQVVSGSQDLTGPNGKDIDITNFTTDASGNIQFKKAEDLVSETFKFKYTGDDAPTFEVTEAKGVDYQIEKITSNAEDGTFTAEEGKYTGTLTGSDNEDEETSNLITVVATNKVQYENNIVINKSLGNGPASTNEIFKFKVTVTDSDGTKTTETAEIHVKQGETTGTWTSNNKYTWYDESKVPTYEISDEQAFQADDNWNEVKDITAKYNPQGLPKTGVLNGNASEIKVDVVNYEKIGSGPLTITKVLDGSDEFKKAITTGFDFQITIEPVDGLELIETNSSNGSFVETVNVTPNNSITKIYNWKYTGKDTNITPKFTVKEINIPDGITLKSMEYVDAEGNNQTTNSGAITGNLKNTETVDDGIKITATNTGTIKSGDIEVTKVFLDESKNPDEVKTLAETRQDSFKVLITVKPKNGSLIYDNTIYTDSLKITGTLSSKSTEKWKFKTEKIYWTGDNPTFTIEEISNSPAWSYVKGELDGKKDTTNSLQGSLVDKKTKSATITNKPRKAIILTTELGGMVWEDMDVDVKGIKSEPDGIYDATSVDDKLLPNIEVRVYKNIYNASSKFEGKVIAKAGDVPAITMTDKDGRWEVTRVGVPVVTQSDLDQKGLTGNPTDYTAEYNVEFVYDGQTYEPTKLLKYYDDKGDEQQGSVTDFKELKTDSNGNYDETKTKENRNKYANSSMAKEISNASEKITEIKGNMPIDDNGITVGTVVLDYGPTEKGVVYKTDPTAIGHTRSILQTTDEYGHVYDTFEAIASTSEIDSNSKKEIGLTFPFEKDFSIGRDDCEIDLANNLKISTADDLIGVAGDCWEAIGSGMLINGGTYQYGGTSIPPKSGTIDCSSFVSFVLYEFGYKSEFAGWQKATPWFVDETNLKDMASKYGWQYFKINGGQNANEAKDEADNEIENGIMPGDIVVRDNGAGGPYGHITFVKDVSGTGKTGRKYTLYDCGAQSNWTNPNNKNGMVVQSSNFIERDGRSGYVIRIGTNKPYKVIQKTTNKYEVTVDDNVVYKVYYLNSSGDYEEIAKGATLNGNTYYIKNSIANYIIDDAGNYIVPKGSEYVKVTKNGNIYTLDPNENFVIAENYKAIYNYCKNINLGLVKKATADAELEKRLTEAKVVVKEKMYQFKYNPNNPQDTPQQSALFKAIKDDELAQTYAEMNKLQINVPKSDYYYRAEIYNSKVGYTLEDYYNKKFSKTYDDTEMDIYLTYNVMVRNVCDGYKFTINSIDDYYSADLELVRAEEKTKIVDGNEKTVADKPKAITYKTNSSGYITDVDSEADIDKNYINISDDTIDGLDGIKYKKMTISNLNTYAPFNNIKPNNDKVSAISMTFKVDKSRFDKTIKLGEKANVAEIASYSTSYANGYVDYATGKSHTGNAGKIDRDSAPGNINTKYINDKNWYEDDTDSAFNVDIKLKGLYEEGNGTDRTIEGMVWEEKRTEEENGYKYGNGQYRGDILKDNDEQVIKGIKTELRERILIPNSDGTYTSHDALLQTDKPLASLGGKTFEQVTEETKNGNTLKFDSTTTTDASGKYTFNGVPVGDYVVRFTYGDKQIDSASYSTAQFYNGQDYKSSIYPNIDKIPTSLDLSKYNDVAENHSNVAVDSEVRRLQVIQKSREITNKNGKVLAASHSTDYADSINEEAAKDGQNLTNKDILLKDYYMYAETPMISFDDLGKTYNLKNIDFAIEERPLTELSLDKQIKEILITTSDGKTLMDAVYDIKYKIDSDGKIAADITLNETKSIGTENLQALDRDKSNSDHGFRYINVDSEVLQGTTITVTYQFSAINAGEVDYTGELANGEWTAGKFHTVCDELSKKLATYDEDKNPETSQGTYIGYAYYYGTKGNNDNPVKTSVKELVDYVDNDMTFDATLNSAQDTSWKTTTEFELKGLVENTGEIKDSNGTIFSTNGNLITSINDVNKNSIVGKELETKRKEDSYEPEATIQLTISKFVSADSDTLQIDNIAEIIRYTNTVGRRDILTITGNADPADAIKKVSEDGNKGPISKNMNYERDTSATELITLSPPTGSSIFIWRLQVAGTIAAAMAIVAGGIILIKKKVLK